MLYKKKKKNFIVFTIKMNLQKYIKCAFSVNKQYPAMITKPINNIQCQQKQTLKNINKTDCTSWLMW